MNKIVYELWSLTQLGEGDQPVPLIKIDEDENYSRIFQLQRNTEAVTAIHIRYDN